MECLQATIEAIECLTKLGEADPLAAAKVIALMTGYHHALRYEHEMWQIISAEETYALPIVNPESGRTSRTFSQGGRFDLIVRKQNSDELMLVEHKSASEEIADPAAPYWKRLAIDSQVSAYALANWQLGRKVTGTLYDVIRKPTIRPKQIAKADVAKLMSERRYCGFDVSDEEIAEAAANDYRETPRLYGLRLLRDIFDEPAKYFQRRSVPRLDGDMLEFAGELWTVARDIRETQKTAAHYRNSGACMNFGRACEYLPLCCGDDTPDSDRWQVRRSAHPEVALDGDTLTHSRIRCYQTCRRKHFYRYELRLERRDDEEAEALVFGRLLHEALRIYFTSQQENQHGYCQSTTTNETISNEAPGVVV